MFICDLHVALEKWYIYSVPDLIMLGMTCNTLYFVATTGEVYLCKVHSPVVSALSWYGALVCFSDISSYADWNIHVPCRAAQITQIVG